MEHKKINPDRLFIAENYYLMHTKKNATQIFYVITHFKNFRAPVKFCFLFEHLICLLLVQTICDRVFFVFRLILILVLEIYLHIAGQSFQGKLSKDNLTEGKPGKVIPRVILPCVI